MDTILFANELVVRVEKKIQAIDIGLASLDIVTTVGKGQLANLNLGAGSRQPPATI